MTEQPTGDDPTTPEGEFIDRRSGKDRRHAGDRRRGGRRHRLTPVDDDRRTGSDRRQQSRRSGVDRRIYNDPRYKKPRVKREAPSVYSTEDAAQVQHMLSRLGHRPQCPVCQGRFTLGPVDRRGIESVRQVWCADCGRGTVVTDCVLARVMILTLIDAVRTLLRVTLDGAGHEVVEPPHAKDAMEVYREHPADVVIIDASALGEAGGREFIRLLRHEVDDPRIIVLAGRPGYGQADPSVAARQLGATRVVRMPCSREDLLVAVREVRP